MGSRVVRFDDIDNTIEDDVQETEFSLDGRSYILDLGKVNRNELELALRPFIEVARNPDEHKVAKKPVIRQVKRAGRGKAIRAWAKDKGISVNDSGAIPRDIQAQYDKDTNK